MAVATFGAGCFWGVEEAFSRLRGVSRTEVGYMGGNTENPTYEEVCSGLTGHAEVAQVTYDAEQVSFEQLLAVFWQIHDPTTLNRQGPDVGTQYRSVIFYHSPDQQMAAEKSRREMDKSGRFPRPIVTAVEPARPFWSAEEYHQQYFAKRGGGSCHLPFSLG